MEVLSREGGREGFGTIWGVANTPAKDNFGGKHTTPFLFSQGQARITTIPVTF